MSVHHSIIRVPSVTEKAMIAREDNKFVFKVAKDATKVEIKDAVEALFEVNVVSRLLVHYLPKPLYRIEIWAVRWEVMQLNIKHKCRIFN